MEPILKIKDLTKIYDNKIVVNKASFEIESGTVCGLLGPNGAGKTTIMKMIVNQVRSDGGNIEYDNNLKIKYLQDVPEFYDFFTVGEYLEFILNITNYNGDKIFRIKEIFSMLNLKSYEDVKIKKLSRGLRQKVGIASVIVDEPDILILDEPVSALDPIGRKEMFDIILSLKGKTTIIFSSHILNDVERICDQIVLISRGNIVLDKQIKEFSLDKKTLLVEFESREELLLFKESNSYECNFNEHIQNCLEIHGEDITKLEKEIFSYLSKKNILVNSVSIKKESLEEIFLKEVKKNA